jgi:C4-dicarboxylate transporter DctM subunit
VVALVIVVFDEAGNLTFQITTPSVGMNLFVIKGIAKAPLSQVISGAAPYAGLMLIGLLLVFIFPPVATWLPDLAGFGR